MNQQPVKRDVNPVQRARLWYALLVLIFGVFAVRVFYLQVIRFDYYKRAALHSQLKQYEVPAERGIISAQLGDGTVPIVMNQKLYTLYADPVVVKHPTQVAAKLQPIIGGNVDKIAKKLKVAEGIRYVVLARKLTPAQSTKVRSFKLPGVGTQEQDYRSYPQGAMAAQLLGFVNDEGKGTYGIEQALNKELQGVPGQLKAVTDINGVPLAASQDNISTQPVAGSNITLTVNVGMQSGLEKILKDAHDKYKTKGTSAVIMDVRTGAIKAMANYPSYDPANYQKVEDGELFQNKAITAPIEPGSITKVLTTATALQKGVITPSTSFYDPGFWTVDGARVADVEEDHSTGQQTIISTLDKSLNTGATWMLMQMGGGQINFRARSTLYDSFTQHFMLGKATGIEQGYEAEGYMPKPQNNGAGINLTYSNVSFGQGYTATALQMVSALSSIVNGGTYYQPHLIDEVVTGTGAKTKVEPKALMSNVVSPQVSNQMISLLEQNNILHIHEGFGYLNFGSNYSIGGKTGTAEVANPLGGYYEDRVNGTYMGFIGGDKPQYAIVVYNFEPTKSTYGGFAGSGTGQPVFANIARMLVNNFGVTPRTP
jgi:stage V sporulation protein D (sporulation-specific penicillin-binding protein)